MLNQQYNMARTIYFLKKFPFGHTSVFLGLVLLAWFTRAATAQTVMPLPDSVSQAIEYQVEMIKRVIPSVVNITTTVYRDASPDGSPPLGVEPMTKEMLGSGFVVRSDGYIITNRHVIAGGIAFSVSFADGTTLPAEFVATTRGIDIAILRVHADHALSTARIGSSARLRQGDEVFAIGNPLGLTSTVTKGIISALDRDSNLSQVDNFIQTDAAINHGNSGGPLFNMAGEVIAVNDAFESLGDSSAGLALSIPIDDVRFVVMQLAKYGKIQVGWLGADLQSMTPELAMSEGLPPRAVGAMVVSVSPRSASGDKLQSGDVIMSVNGVQQNSARGIRRILAELSVGDNATLSILRNGQKITIEATILQYPIQPEYKLPKLTPLPPDVVSSLGLRMAPLDAISRTAAKLESTQRGALIVDVTINSAASFSQFVKGDVIIKIQQDDVASASEVQEKIDSARRNGIKYIRILVSGSTGLRWIAIHI